MQKRVRGVRGRASATGVTELRSWDAFEHEMSLIWTNAREYNEDGSDMYNLAGELEVSESSAHPCTFVSRPLCADPTLRLACSSCIITDALLDRSRFLYSCNRNSAPCL